MRRWRVEFEKSNAKRAKRSDLSRSRRRSARFSHGAGEAPGRVPRRVRGRKHGFSLRARNGREATKTRETIEIETRDWRVAVMASRCARARARAIRLLRYIDGVTWYGGTVARSASPAVLSPAARVRSLYFRTPGERASPRTRDGERTSVAGERASASIATARPGVAIDDNPGSHGHNLNHDAVRSSGIAPPRGATVGRATVVVAAFVVLRSSYQSPMGCRVV